MTVSPAIDEAAQPPAPLVDSHAHLADEVFEADLVDVVARARSAGLRRAMCILAAGDADELRRAERVADLWPDVRFAVGVHPHQAGQFADDPAASAAVVRAQVLANPRVRAVGEIGLDYHYDFAPRPVQQAVFRAQIGVARELGLPIVIHTREADDDTFALLREEAAGMGGVFHCFTGDVARARRALDLGFLLSFAGIVTFPRAADLREAAAMTPDDRLLVETDSPFLAPTPYRGKRNEPAWVSRVVDVLADVRGAPRETIAARACANFDALFGDAHASRPSEA